VEASILADLAPILETRRRLAEQITLRSLEGGQGSPVVLLHGRGHAASIWLPLLPDLARRHRVIAFDLPGFGHSSPGHSGNRWRAPETKGAGDSPATAAKSEAALRFFVDPIEDALVRLNLDRPAIVGHSLGGLLAVELALRQKIQPRSLVLLGAMGLGPEATLRSRLCFHADPERVARRMGSAFWKRLTPLPRTPAGRRLAALEHELHATRGGRPAPSSAFRCLFPLSGPVFHRRDRLGEIRVPVLLVWGEHDFIFPVPVAIAAAAAFPTARLRIVPLGHAPHLEAPEEVLPEILAAIR
jgi:pimeloyl-ACP methyl ester carboxylesterase